MVNSSNWSGLWSTHQTGVAYGQLIKLEWLMVNSSNWSGLWSTHQTGVAYGQLIKLEWLAVNLSDRRGALNTMDVTFTPASACRYENNWAK